MLVTKPVQASLADFELGEEVAWRSLATAHGKVTYLLWEANILSADR